VSASSASLARSTLVGGYLMIFSDVRSHQFKAHKLKRRSVACLEMNTQAVVGAVGRNLLEFSEKLVTC
jgi:hypothetical protein